MLKCSNVGGDEAKITNHKGKHARVCPLAYLAPLGLRGSSNDNYLQQRRQRGQIPMLPVIIDISLSK
jgi:hypothetical protein